MSLSQRYWYLPAVIVGGLFLAGCPKTSSVTPEAENPPADAQKPADEQQAPAEAAVPSLEIGGEYAGAPLMPAALFGYMKADLTAEGRAVLKKNAVVLKAVLKAAPSVEIRVEGHCDARGTLEYNLALGQRRANALRDYYQSFGIPKGAVKTVSYGEEHPVCSDENEACWARNRRGETTLRSSKPVKIPLSDLPNG